jgi:hypothetical protein
MGLLEETINTFITDENIKNFIWFIFDNNLMEHRDIRNFFRNVRWSDVHKDNKDNCIKFHEIFTYFLYWNLSLNMRYDTLSVFPNFQKHVANMFDEQYRNAILNKNTPVKIQTYQKKYGHQASSKYIPERVITYGCYDELANDEFWNEHNIKPYLKSVFEKKFYDSVFAYRVIFSVIDEYKTDNQNHLTFYERIIEKLRNLPLQQNYEHFCHNPVYANFCLEHIRTRKAQFVWFHQIIYNSYKNESNAENMLANEYVVSQIYYFL